MDNLTQAETAELEKRLQKRQIKDFMGTFGNLVDNCFMSCIDDFSSKALSNRETGCVQRCVQKNMATTQRLQDRFQEYNATLAQQSQR